jgi:transposase-like protein
LFSLYARGLAVHEIQGQLDQLYQIEVSQAMSSTVTDVMLEEVAA